MPTVKYKGGMKKFPYNAVGKAQAHSFAQMIRTGRKNKICPAGIAWAKRTFDTYPSAYANMAASKYCKDPNYAKKSKS
jgi:hypothetical protein